MFITDKLISPQNLAFKVQICKFYPEWIPEAAKLERIPNDNIMKVPEVWKEFHVNVLRDESLATYVIMFNAYAMEKPSPTTNFVHCCYKGCLCRLLAVIFSGATPVNIDN